MSQIEKLRADFALVRGWMVACEEWTATDAAEIGAGIAAAVGDSGELAFWCEWMARWAEIALAHRSQMDALYRAAALWWIETGRKGA